MNLQKPKKLACLIEKDTDKLKEQTKPKPKATWESKLSKSNEIFPKFVPLQLGNFSCRSPLEVDELKKMLDVTSLK